MVWSAASSLKARYQAPWTPHAAWKSQWPREGNPGPQLPLSMQSSAPNRTVYIAHYKWFDSKSQMKSYCRQWRHYDEWQIRHQAQTYIESHEHEDNDWDVYQGEGNQHGLRFRPIVVWNTQDFSYKTNDSWFDKKHVSRPDLNTDLPEDALCPKTGFICTSVPHLF